MDIQQTNRMRLPISRTFVLTMLLALALILVGCAETPAAPAPEATTAEEVTEPVAEEEATEPAAEEEATEPAAEEEPAPADDMAQPGEGTTLQVAMPTWDTGWFQNQVIFKLAEELGYTVEDPQVLENPLFYASLSQGDLHFWNSGWLPLHDTFIEPLGDSVTVAGTLVEAGALEGYLIDKATADEYGIDNLEDFQDPEIAALFDSDADGLANLTGCNPGWGCELVIEHHLDAYELRDTVEHDQGTYSALMADTVTRYEAGEPIFFYTWTPNWTIVELVPGEDVVWIEVPFATLPEEQVDFEDATVISGVEGCVADPCNLGFPGNDLAIIANSEWLAENPALAELFANISIPLTDIASQNQRMLDGEDSEEDIAAHADEWIAENRDTVDEWLSAARQAVQ